MAPRVLRMFRTSRGIRGNDFLGADVKVSEGFGEAVVDAVTGVTLRVHVHLPMQMHVNKVMIRTS